MIGQKRRQAGYRASSIIRASAAAVVVNVTHLFWRACFVDASRPRWLYHLQNKGRKDTTKDKCSNLRGPRKQIVRCQPSHSRNISTLGHPEVVPPAARESCAGTVSLGVARYYLASAEEGGPPASHRCRRGRRRRRQFLLPACRARSLDREDERREGGGGGRLALLRRLPTGKPGRLLALVAAAR